MYLIRREGARHFDFVLDLVFVLDFVLVRSDEDEHEDEDEDEVAAGPARAPPQW
jgi:hypothetical protein